MKVIKVRQVGRPGQKGGLVTIGCVSFAGVRGDDMDRVSFLARVGDGAETRGEVSIEIIP